MTRSILNRPALLALAASLLLGCGQPLTLSLNGAALTDGAQPSARPSPSPTPRQYTLIPIKPSPSPSASHSSAASSSSQQQGSPASSPDTTSPQSGPASPPPPSPYPSGPAPSSSPGGMTGPMPYPSGGMTGPGPMPSGGMTGPGPMPSGGMTGPGPMPSGGMTGPGPMPSGGMTGPGPMPSASSGTGGGTGGSGSASTAVPDVFKKLYGAYSITVEGSYVVIKSKGIPSLESIYYKGTEWEDELYENYTGDDGHFSPNPFVIIEQDFTMKIPLNPTVDASHSGYQGTIGIAVDGVQIFDRFNSNGTLVTASPHGFDQNNAHPTPKGVYHYHLEPTGLTAQHGNDALLGFLLDGFPLYGPEENGKRLTSADLDSYHGHTGVTADYPKGIYHYHVTDDEPYIIGDGYYGKPGTRTSN